MSGRDLAIDLGTANTLVYQQGAGIVYDEPTVVAVNARTGEVLAVGRRRVAARRRAPATSRWSARWRAASITDFEITERMLRLIFRTLGLARFPRPRGHGVRAVEGHQGRAQGGRGGGGVGGAALRDAGRGDARRGGGRRAADPRARREPGRGRRRRDAPRSPWWRWAGMVTGASIPVGGFDMDAAIQRAIRQRHGVASASGRRNA